MPIRSRGGCGTWGLDLEVLGAIWRDCHSSHSVGVRVGETQFPVTTSLRTARIPIAGEPVGSVVES